MDFDVEYATAIIEDTPFDDFYLLGLSLIGFGVLMAIILVFVYGLIYY